jgi:hypothetical protein
MQLRTRVAATLVAGTVGLAGLASLAGIANAAKGNGNVAPVAGIRSDLSLVGGEDPSPVATPGRSIATARWDGKVLRIDLAGMDAKRFPVQVENVNRVLISPCVTNLAVGNLTGNPPVEPDPLGGTLVGLKSAGPGIAGMAAHVDIVCDWVDRKRVVQHHETHWLGSLGTATA